MKINIQKKKAVHRYPQLSLYMGLPKIGKSTAMSQVPKSLIIDMEGGRGYSGLNVEALVAADSLKALREAQDYFFSAENKDYKVLVVDHLKLVTYLLAKYVTGKHGVSFVEELKYGQGSHELNTLVTNWVEGLIISLSANPDKYVFLVGHAVDKNGETRLDVNGKNENNILSKMDAIGYIDRDEAGQTTIQFNAGKGVEFGARNPNLAGYKGLLDWSELFKIATKD